MNITSLGFTQEYMRNTEAEMFSGFEISRVIKEFKERYIINDGSNDYEAEVVGNLRYAAKNREDFPAVGDFVLHQCFDEKSAIIHKVLPRTTVLKRQSVGKYADEQIIAANIDIAFIVQSVGHDFNINRLERYLTIVNAGNVLPVLVVTKTDLAEEGEPEALYAMIKERAIQIPVYFISSITLDGFSELNKVFEKGKTYCFIGSSGVGKSTLVNKLLGEEQLETNTISDSTSKGRHTTSYRELIILDNGSIVIDTPGMRELGIADSSQGLEETFYNIMELSEQCRYSDCTHTTENGCAVIQAVENGELNEQSYQNYLRLEREKQHFQSTIAEKRSKDKEFGKMVKRVKKIDKRNLQ